MSKPTVTPEEIAKLAHLAKLHLAEDQLATYTQQINAILDHVRTLEELDVTDVEPLSHVLDLVNVYRKDAATRSISRDDALANAPQQADNSPTVDDEFFLVPEVLKTGQ